MSDEKIYDALKQYDIREPEDPKTIGIMKIVDKDTTKKYHITDTTSPAWKARQKVEEEKDKFRMAACKKFHVPIDLIRHVVRVPHAGGAFVDVSMWITDKEIEFEK